MDGGEKSMSVRLSVSTISRICFIRILKLDLQVYIANRKKSVDFEPNRLTVTGVKIN